MPIRFLTFCALSEAKGIEINMKKHLKVVLIGALIALLTAGAAVAANLSLDEKAAIIDAKVEEGSLSSETASKFLSRMQSRMAECYEDCDGEQEGPVEDRVRLGQEYQIGGFGFGSGDGEGNGVMKKLNVDEQIKKGELARNYHIKIDDKESEPYWNVQR